MTKLTSGNLLNRPSCVQTTGRLRWALVGICMGAALTGCGTDSYDYSTESSSERDLYANTPAGSAPCKQAREETLEQPLEAYVEALTELAEQGEPCAQYGLGTLYQLGYEKFRQDPEKASQYLNMAAEQGHAKALAELSSLE